MARQRQLLELEDQGLIQAFEFTHELSWRLLKDFLADQRVSGISGSRDAMREAVVRGILPAGTGGHLDGHDPQPQPHQPHRQPGTRP